MAEAKDQCGSCKQKVNSKEKAVECEICQLWYHTRCEKISDGTYKILQENNSIHWYCERCNKGIAKVLSALANILKRRDKVEETLDQMEKGLESVRNELKNLKEEMERKIKESDKKEKEVDEKLTREIEELTKTYIHDGTWTDTKMTDMEKILEEEKKETGS